MKMQPHFKLQLYAVFFECIHTYMLMEDLPLRFTAFTKRKGKRRKRGKGKGEDSLD
jgi:hypothetical protein